MGLLLRGGVQDALNGMMCVARLKRREANGSNRHVLAFSRRRTLCCAELGIRASHEHDPTSAGAFQLVSLPCLSMGDNVASAGLGKCSHTQRTRDAFYR